MDIIIVVGLILIFPPDAAEYQVGGRIKRLLCRK
jgi:hypothetical protein